MSCQSKNLAGAKCAVRNGVSKIASMSAAAGGRAGAAFSAGKDKAQSAFSAGKDKAQEVVSAVSAGKAQAQAVVSAGKDKAQAVVSAGKDKAQAVASAGKDKAQSAISAASEKVAPITQNKVVRHFTRGPRAYLGLQKSYAQGHFRVAKAVGGFMKDIKRADATFGENTSGIRRKLNETFGEYQKQKTIGTADMKHGVTPLQVMGGIGGGYAGLLVGASVGSPGLAAFSATLGATNYALQMRDIERHDKWLKTPEGKNSLAQLDQAGDEYETAEKPFRKERSQAIKGAYKKLFSEVRGAQSNVLGGQIAAMRTLAGR